MTTPAPMPGPAPRTWWLLAGLAGVASLGLGWDWYYHPYPGTELFLIPGSSVLLSDGTIQYTPSTFLFFPSIDYGSGVLPGYASHARLVLPVAAVLMVAAVRRGSRSLARTGLAVALIAPVLAGGLTQGSAIFLGGLACATMALRATGLAPVTRWSCAPTARVVRHARRDAASAGRR
ncbi:MAG: hypothetical protein ACR2J5_08785 [Geodermatophilaceae bacterium]